MFADRIEALLTDKVYDADAICSEIVVAGVEAVISAKSNRRNQRESAGWIKTGCGHIGSGCSALRRRWPRIN